MGLAIVRVADGARVAGWCLHGVSALTAAGLLWFYATTETRIWLLVSAAILIINLVVTAIFMVALRKGAKQDCV